MGSPVIRSEEKAPKSPLQVADQAKIDVTGHGSGAVTDAGPNDLCLLKSSD